MTTKNIWIHKYNQELDENYTTLTKRAVKNLTFALMQQCGEDICHRCNKKIESVDELSIEHKQSYITTNNEQERECLFFDLDNIAWSHIRCNFSAASAKKGKYKYNRVDVYKDDGVNILCRVRTKINGKMLSIGKFNNLEEAAQIHDLIVMKYHKEQGILNFPEKIDEYRQIVNNGWSCEKIEKLINH